MFGLLALFQAKLRRGLRVSARPGGAFKAGRGARGPAEAGAPRGHGSRGGALSRTKKSTGLGPLEVTPNMRSDSVVFLFFFVPSLFFSRYLGGFFRGYERREMVDMVGSHVRHF